MDEIVSGSPETESRRPETGVRRQATLEESAADFLSQKRIAVVGVSRDPKDFATMICRKLREIGHDVIPINPSANEIDGHPCYATLRDVPGGVDAVLITTRPEVAPEIVRQCIDAGVTRVWMHRSFGHGSVSREAVELCRENGVRVIDGACPMMFCQPVDPAHRCIRWILGVFGRLPKPDAGRRAMSNE